MTRQSVPRMLMRGQSRSGSVLTLFASLMPVVFACLAFAVDVGYICLVRTRLQVAADAAAIAAAQVLKQDANLANSVAISYAEQNVPSFYGEVLKAIDITPGVWDEGFTPTGVEPNCVKVVLRRTYANDNPVQLFFAPVIGTHFSEAVAEAVAFTPSGGAMFRFLLDEEMIDSDELAIEYLAAQLGVPSETLIEDGDNDGFLDLPPGTILELPTGQQGDEAMFDVTSYAGQFPFTSSSQYSTKDFLAEGTVLQQQLGTQPLQDIEWTPSNAPHILLIGKKLLDPVPSVDPVDSHAVISGLPDPSITYLSPVFKSDVSMAETDPAVYGSPAANLQGERRGLLAYRILSSANNPAGGSYLPLLTIEIVDPSTVDLDSVAPGETNQGSAYLVE